MSRLLDFKTKIHTLTEIQSILGAMKNLAVIEMNKMAKLINAQKHASATITAALADFEFFYNRDLQIGDHRRMILCLLIGSERGFCGPFNERIIECFHDAASAKENIKAVVVGRKLALKMQDDSRVELQLNGPSSTDEIPVVIGNLATQLLPYADCRWMFIHNDGDSQRSLASFPLETRRSSDSDFFADPPILNMTPKELYPQLLEQLLFSVLSRALYASFMAENRERLHHMEGALRQIEKQRSQLSLRLNGLRQEEITEELEILMLSSSDTQEKEKL